MGSDEEDEDDGPLEPLSPTREHEHPVASVVVRAASTATSSVADEAVEEREIEAAAVSKKLAPPSLMPEAGVEGESPSIL